MSWLAIGTTAVSAAGTIYSASQANKNKAKPINISDVISQAQTQAQNDLQNSINLENQYLPGQSNLRSNSFNLSSAIATGQTSTQQLQNILLGQSGSAQTNPSASVNNPLTMASLGSILQSLNEGGQLDPDTQAQVTQGALQGAGTAGISGSGAGRGLVARDLGLTSLQLLQSRQNQASAAGNAYGALGLQGQSLQLQDFLGRLGLANSAVGLQDQYSLGLGNLMNNTALPNSGLSAGQVASLAVGNTNILNQANQQSAANTASETSALTGDITSLMGNKNVQSGIASLFSGSGGTSGASGNGLF